MEVVRSENGAGEVSAETNNTTTPVMRSVADLPMDKFPRVKSVREGIEGIKDLILALKDRKELATNVEGLSEFDKNERKIIVLKTDMELSRYWTQVIQKEKEIEDYLNRVVFPYIDEIDANYDDVIEKARKRALTDDVLAKTLKENSPSKELCLENWEHKFNHYVALKNYLQPKK